MNPSQPNDPTAKPPTRQGLPDDQPLVEEQRPTPPQPRRDEERSIPFLPVG
ncbi:MAG TPA: hypothetical protein VHZ95_05670 [Polyangiales bacterium]|jgi:hypothetical protein|nr:hypothetical protein [Polyangiales bacterium]